jgi:hypothetical protein
VKGPCGPGCGPSDDGRWVIHDSKFHNPELYEDDGKGSEEEDPGE